MKSVSLTDNLTYQTDSQTETSPRNSSQLVAIEKEISKSSAYRATKLKNYLKLLPYKMQPYSNSFLQTGNQETINAGGFKSQCLTDFLIQNMCLPWMRRGLYSMECKQPEQSTPVIQKSPCSSSSFLHSLKLVVWRAVECTQNHMAHIF
jgi:hypothetical protein